MKNVTIRFLTVLTFILSTSFLLAQETERDGIEGRLTICLEDSSLRTQMDRRRCVYEAIMEYQMLIDTLTSELKTLVSSEGQEKLKLSDESWKEYYKQESEFIANLTEERSGSRYSNMVADELLELLRQRALFLETMLVIYKEPSEED
ncbi:lysozyme inhibitor LprI family protein [Croceimicrobium hydrocarbonivorans]|uniref:Lysozyme inhibitor LprI N-terminal domain-containing protein n=1 Tax=Croceimicrobium hydrocarbonivorans TaxID=2761580 RepID=A0A7H0VD58_9FLAO|nr:lysozyme inhibitor LprI family protein [Croceimicrobium hydrocarbonivorans]QNR23656.1 hypothetical protein H4K34_14930 [Croceimicrobium hydrocarbonivorans]